MTFTVPSAFLMVTAPPALSCDVTKFATIVCAWKLRFEAVGGEVPAGYTVRRLEDEPLTATTLMTTPVAPAGTELPLPGSTYPVTWSVSVPPAPSAWQPPAVPPQTPFVVLRILKPGVIGV